MRIRTILAAAAAPAALAAVLLGTAGQASAATTPNPGGGALTCTANMGGTINANLDVPAGQTCILGWAHVTGNVTVEGQLYAAATVFDRNVTVTGPGSELWLRNQPSHIKGNLTVHDSSGDLGGNSYGTSFGDNADDPNLSADLATAGGVSRVDGNFTFVNNTGRPYIDGSPGSPRLIVGGNFTASGNTQYPAHWDTGGLTVAGKTSVS